uniref:Uncharacterized protein n=1 Tax=Cacopsylla melanoneura TaxID=428564 RepID=A0A8D8QL39_9HEMI
MLTIRCTHRIQISSTLYCHYMEQKNLQEVLKLQYFTFQPIKSRHIIYLFAQYNCLFGPLVLWNDQTKIYLNKLYQGCPTIRFWVDHVQTMGKFQDKIRRSTRSAQANRTNKMAMVSKN